MISKATVVCIPYAGGSSYMFNDMSHELAGRKTMVHAIDLPGKGSRIEEMPCVDFQSALNDTVKTLLELGNYSSNYVFGYSMGALLAYESVRYIFSTRNLLPPHLFLAACDPPAVYMKQPAVPLEKDEEFIEYLIKGGGITRELADDQDFKDFFLPIVKNDHKILDTYKFREEDSYIPMSATILYSDDETDITEWGKYFDNSSFYHFTGGHFFIQRDIKRICQIVSHTLEK